MAVGDEDVVQVLEPDAGLQDLALGAFAAINEEAILIVLDDLGCQAALGGGRRSRGAEKDDFKHFGNYTLSMGEAVASCQTSLFTLKNCIIAMWVMVEICDLP